MAPLGGSPSVGSEQGARRPAVDPAPIGLWARAEVRGDIDLQAVPACHRSDAAGRVEIGGEVATTEGLPALAEEVVLVGGRASRLARIADAALTLAPGAVERVA